MQYTVNALLAFTVYLAKWVKINRQISEYIQKPQGIFLKYTLH